MEARIISRPHPDDDLGFCFSKIMKSEEAVLFKSILKMQLQNKFATLILDFKVTASEDKDILIAEVKNQNMFNEDGPYDMRKDKLLFTLLLEGHGWKPI